MKTKILSLFSALLATATACIAFTFPELEAPITVSDCGYYFDGGTYYAVIAGKDGFPHQIFLDRRGPLKNEKPLRFWHTAYPEKPGSIMVPKGSIDEDRIHKYLKEAFENQMEEISEDDTSEDRLRRESLETMIRIFENRDSQQVAAGNDR